MKNNEKKPFISQGVDFISDSIRRADMGVSDFVSKIPGAVKHVGKEYANMLGTAARTKPGRAVGLGTLETYGTGLTQLADQHLAPMIPAAKEIWKSTDPVYHGPDPVQHRPEVTPKPPDKPPDKPLTPEQQKADDERKIIAKDPKIGAGYQANKGTWINEYGIPVVGGVEYLPGKGFGSDLVRARQLGAPPGQEKAWALAMQAAALAPQPTGVSMGRTSYSEGAPGWEGLLSQAIASDASIYGADKEFDAKIHQTNVFAQTTRRGQDMGLLEEMYGGGQGKDLMEAEIAKAAGTAIAQGAGLWMMEYEDTPEWRANLSGLIGNVRQAVVDSGLVTEEQFKAYLGGKPNEQHQTLMEALSKSGILLQ